MKAKGLLQVKAYMDSMIHYRDRELNFSDFTSCMILLISAGLLVLGIYWFFLLTKPKE